MTDRVTTKHCDRQLHTDPPAPGYRLLGWHCIYHEQTGRNCMYGSNDCDLVPLWSLEIKEALNRMAVAPRG